MVKIKGKKGYFSVGEIVLWASSLFLITLAFVLFDRQNYLSFISSLIGATSLIFNAKGNPIGQVLIVVFSVLYGIISWTYAYYGEMITYLFMTAPMAVLCLVEWLKNPYKNSRTEVKVNAVGGKEIVFALALTLVITIIFYFVLQVFNTTNLFISTVSVATSFFAAYLTFRRSPYFALAYALNDIVLIVLWTLATIENLSYVSVIVCFFIFLINDVYGFISWIKMQKRQAEN